MPAHKNSFIVIQALLVHALARLTCHVNLTPGRRLLQANLNITGSDRLAAGLLARACLSDYQVLPQ